MTTTDIATYIQAITWDDVIDAAGVVLVFLLAYSPFASKLHALVTQWQVYTATTPTPYDDRVARVARAFTGFLVAVIALGVEYIPRLTMGLASLRATTDAATAKARARRSTPFITMLALAVLSSACGGAGIQTTRSALLITDGVVDRIDAEVAPLAEDAHERALAESTSREEYDRRMQPWVRVSSAITGVQAALLASAITVEAVESGQDGDVLGAIGCTVEALAELAAMLPDVGVDVPPTLRTAIALLAELAGDVCPAPPESQPDVPEVAQACVDGAPC